MMGALRRKVRAWLDVSVGNRFGAVLLALTLGFMTVAGVGTFLYVLHLTRRIANDALVQDTRDIAKDLERVLDAICDDNRLLAANPTVVSAVLDTRGQETYLNPLLSRFRPLGRTPDRICVTDYRGRSLGCASAKDRSETDRNRLAHLIEEGRPAARITLAGDNRPILDFVSPVIYEGTGSAEGAVVASYDLAGLVHRTIGNPERFAHLHLSGADGDLYRAGRDEEHVIHAARSLEVDGALEALQLHLSLGVNASAFNQPVMQLMAAFGLAGLLLVAAAVWIARRAVPPLVARLGDITAKANQVADGTARDFSANDDGVDEIGQLARAFETMTRRLNEINQELELKVELRTTELSRQQAMLHSILDAVPGAILQFRLHADGSTSVPFVSQALRQVYGVEADEVVEDASPIFTRVHPDDIDAHMASIHESARSLAPWQQDFRITRPDGSAAWLHVNALPQREPDDSTLWHGIITDITDHKHAELALADSESYSKTLFEHSYIPLVIMDPQTGAFIDCNDAAVAIFHLGCRDAVLGKNLRDVSAPTQYDGSDSAPAALARIAQARSAGFADFHWRYQRSDGEIWDGEVSLMRFRHGGRDLMQFSLRDVTEQRRSEAAIWRQANFDPLTGLANRSLCADRLERALARARRYKLKVGVLFIDLDGFKDVNDSLGHARGDELLIEVARRLQGCIREQDTAARLGGDEFILMVQDLAYRGDLLRVAEEAIARLNQPFVLADQTRQISGSVGIAVFPDDGETPEALLAVADQALYQAKRAGKNCVSNLAAERPRSAG